MKNIERLAAHVTKNGSDGIMIHTIPGTSNWIICEKIEKDKWTLSMCDPMGNVTYNLGTATNAEHVALWMEITTMSIENKATKILQARQLTDKINNFKKNYASNYKKFIKLEKKKTKQKRPQYRRRNTRSKKAHE